jgi:cell fate (sporulation/competence/biofilm development) regulator YlbF (YheA/YmcA/DUF963 family)
MQTTIEETPVIQKTRELCETILEQPNMRAARERIETFLADESAQRQLEGVQQKGQVLHEKQHRAEQLTSKEISDFEKEREALMANPVARDFLDAQQEMQEMQESIQKLVSKALQLGRLPAEEELGGGSCGHGCGCH